MANLFTAVDDNVILRIAGFLQPPAISAMRQCARRFAEIIPSARRDEMRRLIELNNPRAAVKCIGGNADYAREFVERMGSHAAQYLPLRMLAQPEISRANQSHGDDSAMERAVAIHIYNEIRAGRAPLYAWYSEFCPAGANAGMIMGLAYFGQFSQCAQYADALPAEDVITLMVTYAARGGRYAPKYNATQHAIRTLIEFARGGCVETVMFAKHISKCIDDRASFARELIIAALEGRNKAIINLCFNLMPNAGIIYHSCIMEACAADDVMCISAIVNCEQQSFRDAIMDGILQYMPPAIISHLFARGALNWQLLMQQIFAHGDARAVLERTVLDARTHIIAEFIILWAIISNQYVAEVCAHCFSRTVLDKYSTFIWIIGCELARVDIMQIAELHDVNNAARLWCFHLSANQMQRVIDSIDTVPSRYYDELHAYAWGRRSTVARVVVQHAANDVGLRINNNRSVIFEVTRAISIP